MFAGCVATLTLLNVTGASFLEKRDSIDNCFTRTNSTIHHTTDVCFRGCGVNPGIIASDLREEFGQAGNSLPRVLAAKFFSGNIFVRM